MGYSISVFEFSGPWHVKRSYVACMLKSLETPAIDYYSLYKYMYKMEAIRTCFHIGCHIVIFDTVVLETNMKM